MPIQPLAEIAISPQIIALPKADLHVHQEERARLDRILTRRENRAPFDWRAWSQHLLDDVPAGEPRLDAMCAPDASWPFDARSEQPEYIVAKIADALLESAADGSIYTEIRFGKSGKALPRNDFMALFRKAERRVQQQYPNFYAEALGFIYLRNETEAIAAEEEQLGHCLRLAQVGLAGVDFIVAPYAQEADPALWQIAYRLAERAVDAGLGVTVHAAEFSTANLAAALKTPGLSRIGHGVYATSDERLLDQLIESGATVECSLSCNVVLGAVDSYEAHPIRHLIDAGVPVTLNTDDPVRVWTTIGREYAIAYALGFSVDNLLEITRQAVQVAFTSPARRAKMLDKLENVEKAQC